MSKRANNLAIGVFVLLAVVIAVTGAIILSAGELFSEKYEFILYFDGDLSGLSTGAPVTYKGVHIGKVTDISIQYDVKNNTISVPVIIEIDRRCFTQINCINCPEQGIVEPMKLHIKRGLRAQLQTQSLITGKLKVALVYKKDAPEVYHANNSKLTEIPTILGSLDTLAKQISDLPLEEIVENLRTTTDSLAEISKAGDVKRILASVERVSGKLEKVPLDDIAADIKTATDSISKMMQSGELSKLAEVLNNTLAETRELIATIKSESRPLQTETLTLLDNMNDAAESMRYFIDYLQRHPEVLLHGKGKD